jgi:large subunit ribosomal protein L29
MKAVELRKKTENELYLEIIKNRKNLLNIRLQKASGQLENNSQIRIIKKDVARLKTLLTEKKKNITHKKSK